MMLVTPGSTPMKSEARASSGARRTASMAARQTCGSQEKPDEGGGGNKPKGSRGVGRGAGCAGGTAAAP